MSCKYRPCGTADLVSRFPLRDNKTFSTIIRKLPDTSYALRYATTPDFTYLFQCCGPEGPNITKLSQEIHQVRNASTPAGTPAAVNGSSRDRWVR
ncbi:hypothetical protein B0H67DRAFT_268794 [Lasiosphaeris hirsuta]|uniref:Uncharacterized protein n=1 Tax=Lasiosphaeris hirsuta TaxID=260670 RepID=A0AA40A862_9PEZI|nr:hypothetical protein B0H67DRAFT_268794 [Lasiosphaeris hirsuta]